MTHDTFTHIHESDPPSNEHANLLRLVRYEPHTGKFFRVTRQRGVPFHKPLGHVEANGYRRIVLKGGRYLAHRLAWFYVHGVWPDKDIDHINMARDDNRIANLRLATVSQNHANTRALVSKSGLKGAHWNAQRGYWQSYIKVNGKNIFLGRFSDPQSAHEAYAAAARSIHGEFARTA